MSYWGRQNVDPTLGIRRGLGILDGFALGSGIFLLSFFEHSMAWRLYSRCKRPIPKDLGDEEIAGHSAITNWERKASIIDLQRPKNEQGQSRKEEVVIH